MTNTSSMMIHNASAGIEVAAGLVFSQVYSDSFTATSHSMALTRATEATQAFLTLLKQHTE